MLTNPSSTSTTCFKLGAGKITLFNKHPDSIYAFDIRSGNEVIAVISASAFRPLFQCPISNKTCGDITTKICSSPHLLGTFPNNSGLVHTSDQK